MSSKHITIDGVEYIATPVSVEEQKADSGYERAEFEKYYWCVDVSGDTKNYKDYKSLYDNKLFQSGNYYKNKQLAEDNHQADKLLRQLRQWQALNDKPVDWNNDSPKYSISYNYERGLGISTSTINRMAGVVYFSSRSKVKEAYELFKPDLLWYFTEYRQRLDEPSVVWED